MCAGAARYARMQHHQDEEHRKALGKNAQPTEPLPEDGRRTFIRQMTPLEVAARKAKRKTPSKVQPVQNRKGGGRRGDA